MFHPSTISSKVFPLSRLGAGSLAVVVVVVVVVGGAPPLATAGVILGAPKRLDPAAGAGADVVGVLLVAGAGFVPGLPNRLGAAGAPAVGVEDSAALAPKLNVPPTLAGSEAAAGEGLSVELEPRFANKLLVAAGAADGVVEPGVADAGF